jgi:glycosyltransferase involved in cell wall biosynthesis
MDCLYVSHTGMTEPLGRSQVLPYLFGLARHGFEIEVLSHEPVGTPRSAIERTRALVGEHGIGWIPLVRSSSHALGVKVLESGRALMRGLLEAIRRRPKIVHARSYVPAAVADAIATLSPRTKMLFDCRGMLGDEYVDAGWWTEDRLEYKLLKRFERRAFRRAEAIVVLTEALKRWLRTKEAVPTQTPIQVVPCCVDTNRFVADPVVREQARSALGLGDRFTLVYSGSLGSWYLEREMARFASRLRRLRADLVWVALTHSDPAGLRRAAREEGIEDLVVRKATPEDMPRLLPAGDAGISFIRPCFSKMGSSPTKVAEYLAAGMPVVVNSGVGDQADLAAEKDACVVVNSHESPDLDAAARAALELGSRPYEARAAAARGVARDRFGIVEVGVPRYEALYRALLDVA